MRKRIIGPKVFTAAVIGLAALLAALAFLYPVAPRHVTRHRGQARNVKQARSLGFPVSPGSALLTTETAAADAGLPFAQRATFLRSFLRQVKQGRQGKKAAATEAATRDTAAASLRDASREKMSGAAARARLVANYGKLPLAFEANQGQTNARVKFLSRGSGYTLFLTPTDAVLSLVQPRTAGQPFAQKAPFLRSFLRQDKQGKQSKPIQTSALRMRLAGANPYPQIQGLDELRGKSNYLLGNDPKKWRTNVPNYARVEYRNIYRGVNLVYYGHQGRLEDDFEVEPGANPRAIRLEISGAKKITLDHAGNAVLSVPGGQVVLEKPAIYQQLGGRDALRQKISGHYVLEARNRLGFALGAYDRTRRVVIDPTLVYSTYLGAGADLAFGIAVDNSGDAIIVGQTTSTNFPLASPFQASCKSCSSGLSDAFVSKLNPSGSALVYSSYLGGNSTDFAHAVAVDSSGNAYVTGFTTSTNFPTTFGALGNNTFSPNPPGSFVTKIDPSGGVLYSAIVAGSNVASGFGNSIAVDSSGDAFIVGFASAGFATTPGVVQPNCLFLASQGACGGNPFVAELNAAGSALVYGTYLGETNNANGVALDSSGNAYVTGNTFSTNFPTTTGSFDTACQSFFGTGDSFLAKLSPGGTSLVYSTCLGTAADANAVAVDSSGDAYITGILFGGGFPALPTTPGAFQTTCGVSPSGTCSEDAFVAKFNPTGSGLIYATYLGGSGFEQGNGIAVDSAGEASVVGFTTSTNFPLKNATITSIPPFATASFVSELSANGSQLVFSTYLSASGTAVNSNDVTAYAVALDSTGNAYVTGGTNSLTFPVTAGAFQTTIAGALDAFVTKFSTGTTAASADLSLTMSASPNPIAVSSNLTYTLTVTNNGPSNATGVTLTDTLPTGTSFQSGPSSPGCANSGGTVTCSIGSLNNGAVATITLVVTTPATAASSLSDTASVKGNETDPVLSNNTATTAVNVTLPVNLSIVKTAPATGTTNQNLTYTIKVTNTSVANSATNVTVTDPLAPGVNFQSDSPSQGTCTNPAVGTQGLVNCNLGTVASGGTATISLVVQPTLVNSALANTATVTADQANSNPNNSSTATVNVKPLGSAKVNVSESIHVTDMPGALGSALVSDPENVTVTDTPGALGAAMVPVSEPIHVTDTPGALGAAMVPVSEPIHVTDTPTTAFLVPRLTITLTGLTVLPGSGYFATFRVSNTGTATANNVSVTGSKLVTIVIVLLPPPLPPLIGPVATFTTTPLPKSFGNISAGSSVTVNLTYPITAVDPAGRAAVVDINATFAGGSAGGSFKTTLP